MVLLLLPLSPAIDDGEFDHDGGGGGGGIPAAAAALAVEADGLYSWMILIYSVGYSTTS